jgi:hypothetical protein
MIGSVSIKRIMQVIESYRFVAEHTTSSEVKAALGGIIAELEREVSASAARLRAESSTGSSRNAQLVQ